MDVKRVLRAEVKMMIRCGILYRQEDLPRVDNGYHKNVGQVDESTNQDWMAINVKVIRARKMFRHDN